MSVVNTNNHRLKVKNLGSETNININPKIKFKANGLRLV
jgi:hypothetical protein